MFNTPNNNKNTTRILKPIRYPDPSFFILSHTRLQRVTIITRKGGFIFHLLGKEDVRIGIGSIYKVYNHLCFL